MKKKTYTFTFQGTRWFSGPSTISLPINSRWGPRSAEVRGRRKARNDGWGYVVVVSVHLAA